MIRAHKTDKSLLRLFHKKWESLYGPYGKIASLIGYDTPVLFEYIISTAFFFYTFLLPISYTTYGNQNVLITFIILYFYIGLKSAGLLLQNPFVALPKGVTIFPIATKVSKETRNNIENIQRYCLTNTCTKKMSNKIKLDLDWFHFTLDSFSLLSFSLSWLVSISPVTLGISSGTLASFFPSYIRLDHADKRNSCIAVAPCWRATSFISFFMWGYLDNIIGMVVCSQ